MEWGHRWARLFDDLEAASQAQAHRELDSEIADRTRRERARIPLIERLCAHRGAHLQLRLVGGARANGTLVDVGVDWLALAPSASRGLVVPLGAVASASGLTARSEAGASARRFLLGSALREISRDRLPAQVTDRFGSSYTGTIDVVGADFLDLAEHPVDEARRSANVRSVRTLPFTSLASVQTG